jgi:hypothetical protein
MSILESLSATEEALSTARLFAPKKVRKATKTLAVVFFFFGVFTNPALSSTECRVASTVLMSNKFNIVKQAKELSNSQENKVF